MLEILDRSYLMQLTTTLGINQRSPNQPLKLVSSVRSTINGWIPNQLQPVPPTWSIIRGVVPNKLEIVINFKQKYTDTSEGISLNTAWKVSKYRVLSGPYFPAYSVSLHIHFEYEKIWTRKNSVFGHFPRSESQNSIVKKFFENLWGEIVD